MISTAALHPSHELNAIEIIYIFNVASIEGPDRITTSAREPGRLTPESMQSPLSAERTFPIKKTLKKIFGKCKPVNEEVVHNYSKYPSAKFREFPSYTFRRTKSLVPGLLGLVRERAMLLYVIICPREKGTILMRELYYSYVF